MVAAATVAFITRPPAPGITGDSLFYTSGAWALAKSARLAYATQDWRAKDSLIPMTRVMPGFSVPIALGVRAGMSSVSAARIVQVASAFGTVFVASWLSYALAGSIAATLVAASLLALPIFVQVHLYVLTEPLFLLTVVTALFLMTRVAPNPVALGMTAALATAVRYPGVAVTMAVCLWMLLRPGSAAERLRRAVVAGLPTTILLAFWIVHTRSSEAAEPIRSFGIYGGLGVAVRDAVSTGLAWLAPGSRPVTRIVLATGLSTALILALAERIGQRSPAGFSNTLTDRRWRAVGAALLFILCYLIVVFASRAFADPLIELRARMLLPALVAAQIAIAIALTAWLRPRAPIVRWLTLGVVAAWFVVSARTAGALIVREREVGLDVIRLPVRESTVLRWLRAFDGSQRAVFSNHPLAVNHLLMRDARWWPAGTSPDTLREFAAVVRARNGLIVSFAAHDQWVRVVPDSTLVRLLALRLVARLPDGSVWELPERSVERTRAALPTPPATSRERPPDRR